MKVLSILSNEKKNAGPKAPTDVEKILYETYNAKIMHYSRNIIDEIKIIFDFMLFNLYKDYIVIQAPFIYKSCIYNLLPKKRTIIFIHDISGLRNGDSELLKKELNIFRKFKYVIVHNEKMKKFLIMNDVEEKNIYELGIFDYLIEENQKHSWDDDIQFQNNEILYAGNLKKDKSPFIYQLDEERMNFYINLYGIGNEKINNKKLLYKGSFEPDNPTNISGKLGLVWDGNFDESDEKEGFKNYTKYNNPHKLSCYLATGIPVIVWDKSSVADLVKKYNVGYTISNIYDINKINFKDYLIKKENAEKLGKKVREGYFIKKVISEIIEEVNF